MYKSTFNIEELINATGAQNLKSGDLSKKYSISTDSRTIQPDNVYLPITGANFNGHDFINAAVERNCKSFFIDSDHKEMANNLLLAENILLVKDTTEAYLKIANFQKNKINPKVVGITGSSGKTTTKEFVFAVLNQNFKTQKSQLNHNNEIGLCQTILSMEEDTEFLVAEMGMRGSGEIELLSKYAQPDIAIITNIGPAHIGRLGSIENIAKAKCEITKSLKTDGTLISYDDELIRNNLEWDGKTIFYSLKEAKIKKMDNDGSIFKYKGFEYQLNQIGEYNILNSIAAIETGLVSGMKPDDIQTGLLNFQNAGQRNEQIVLSNGALIINDCYNSNPESVKAAIKAVVDSYEDKEIILVIGDMLELGEYEEKYHTETGEFINNLDIKTVLTVGNLIKHTAKAIDRSKTVKHFEETQSASEYLKKHIKPDNVVLLKASRGMAFEKIVDKLKEEN